MSTGPKTPAQGHPRNMSSAGRRPQSFCFFFFPLSSLLYRCLVPKLGRLCLVGVVWVIGLNPSCIGVWGIKHLTFSLFCNGRARAPPRLMRWEIPKQREEFQMLQNKRMIRAITTATFPSHGRAGLQNSAKVEKERPRNEETDKTQMILWRLLNRDVPETFEQNKTLTYLFKLINSPIGISYQLPAS